MRSADLTYLTLETNTGLGHYDVINITDYIQHACMYMHAKTSHNSTFCTCTVSSCGHQLSIRCYNIDILMDSWNEPFQQIPSTIVSTTAQARTGELVGPLSSIPVGPPTVPHSAKSSHTLPVV